MTVKSFRYGSPWKSGLTFTRDVLLPHDRQRHVLAFEFAMHRRPARLGETPLALSAAATGLCEQPGFQHRVGDVIGQRPGQPRCLEPADRQPHRRGRRIAIRFARMDRREPMWGGREGVADVVVTQRDGGNRGKVRVPPWLNASASMASSGQIQSSGLIDTGPATIAAT